MKLEIWKPKEPEEKVRSDIWYVTLDYAGDVANSVELCVVDTYRRPILRGTVVSLIKQANGNYRICRTCNVDPNLPFDLDDEGRVKLTDE